MSTAKNADPRAIDHVVWAVPSLDEAAQAAENAGFSLTPRASHPDHMGTANRLVQFYRQNFIEFLEVDRPLGISSDLPERSFSFGWHNRAYLEQKSGVSMLVFTTSDAQADTIEFAALGLPSLQRFDFGREAKGPDGMVRPVAFKLAFAPDPGPSGLVCFTCENVHPENFWKPAFQRHTNGALGISKIVVEAAEPEAMAHYLAKVARSEVQDSDCGYCLPCLCGQRIDIVPARPSFGTKIREVVLRGTENAVIAEPAWGETHLRIERDHQDERP